MVSWLLGILINVLGGFLGTIIAMILQMVLAGIVSLVQISELFFMNAKPIIGAIGGVPQMMSVMRVMAMSLLGVVAAFQILKSMFSYLGFESDEPWKIGARTLFFGFIAYYGYEICFKVLDIFGALMDILVSSNAMASYHIDWMNNFLNAAAIPFLVPIMTLFMCFKLFMLVFRFGERFVLTLILILASPLAFITGVGKTTKGIMQGWIKVFMGNLCVQMMQFVMVVLICQMLSQGTQNALNSIISNSLIARGAATELSLLIGGTNILAYMLQSVLVMGAITVLEKLEEIMRDISISAGIGGSPLMGPLGAISTASSAVWGLGNLGLGGGGGNNN